MQRAASVNLGSFQNFAARMLNDRFRTEPRANTSMWKPVVSDRDRNEWVLAACVSAWAVPDRRGVGALLLRHHGVLWEVERAIESLIMGEP